MRSLPIIRFSKHGIVAEPGAQQQADAFGALFRGVESDRHHVAGSKREIVPIVAVDAAVDELVVGVDVVRFADPMLNRALFIRGIKIDLRVHSGQLKTSDSGIESELLGCVVIRFRLGRQDRSARQQKAHDQNMNDRMSALHGSRLFRETRMAFAPLISA